MIHTITQLNQVVISAGRYEQRLSEVTISMEIIKPALVQNTNTTNLETAVDQVPGVSMIDGQANIRGGSGFSYGAGSRVLVLVDDLPVLSGDAGDVKWNFLPVENLEQIEIIKGASSSLFGSSALNGVINIRTAYPRNEPETKIVFYSGMYDEPKRKELKWWTNSNPVTAGANFFHSRRIRQFDLVIGGHVFTDNGYRQGEDEQRFRMNMNTRYRFKNIKGLSAGINGNAMATRGGTFLMWQDDSTGALRPMGGLDTATTTLSNFVNRRLTVDPFVNYTDVLKNSHKIRTRYYRTENSNDSQQESFSDFYYSEYQFHRKFEKLNLNFTSGAMGSFTRVKGDLYSEHQGYNRAFYGQLDKKIKLITLSFGARWEYYKLDSVSSWSDPVLRSGINVQLAEASFLRASFGEGYRFPSIAEKFVRTAVGSSNLYPNDSLNPETGWSAEIGFKQGVKLKDWSGYIDAALFHSEYKNMMEFSFGQWGNIFKDPVFGLGFKSINVGDIKIDGVDFTVAGQGKIGALDVSLLAGYTYLEPVQYRYDSAYVRKTGISNYMGSDSSNFLKYRFRHMAKSDLEIGYKKISVGFSMRYNSFMVNIDKLFDDGLLPLLPGMKEYREQHGGGTWVFDQRISYSINVKAKVSFVIKNLFNKEYVARPYDMQPMRSFTVQFVIAP
jgi:iron complex outermembrane receptor protein